MPDSEPDPRYTVKSGMASAPLEPAGLGQNMDVTGEGQLAGEAKMGPQWTGGKEGGARSGKASWWNLS